jgi:hypothetical protein
LRQIEVLVGQAKTALDTESSVRIENAGFRSVREINPVNKLSMANL